MIYTILVQLPKAAKAGDSLRLEELRERLVKALAQSPTRVVILVDDLDRLDRDEIHMLFRLVKACTDLPNVCFVLAFDEDMVAASLGARYAEGGISAGRSFLEKVIQVPLWLPIATSEDLRTICFEQVKAIIASAGVKLTDKEFREFSTGFEHGVMVRLTTLRVANRYGNGLRFAFFALAGKVNPVDLLLIEALRAFYPDIYALVRNNYSDFSGIEIRILGTNADKSRAGRLLSPVLERLNQDEAEAVKHLLIDLFPCLKNIYKDMTDYYHPDDGKQSTREKRISSPRYCPRYFTYAVDVLDAEMTSLLGVAATSDVEAVRELLNSLFTGKMAARLIEKLRLVESTLDEVTAKTLALAIAPLGGALPNPLDLLSSVHPFGQAAVLTSHLLARIPDRKNRMSVAIQVVKTAEPFWFAAECIRWFRVTDRPEKENSNALTKEETKQVRIQLVKRIKAAAKAGDPLFDPSASRQGLLLFEWQFIEGTGPVQEHLQRVFATAPSQISAFLKSMADRVWNRYCTLPRLRDFTDDTLKKIRRLIDLNVLANLIRDNISGDFEAIEWPDGTECSDEQRLVEQFMYIYNAWKTKGEPPDSISEPSQVD